jgi:hypothetical protein
MSAPDEMEIARIKACCEDLMADYVRSVGAYAEYMRKWNAKNPRGFRCRAERKEAS